MTLAGRRIDAAAGPLLTALASAPDAAGVVAPDGRILADRAALARSARLMLRRAEASGLTEGARVALLLPGGPAAGVAALVLCHVTGVLPLNPALPLADLAAQAGDAQADAVIALRGDPAGAALARALDRPHLAARATGVALDWDGRLDGVDGTRAPGLVLLTSGSTGTPKRVPLTAAQLHHSARNIAAHLHLSPGDRALHALPMFHVGAIVDLLLAPLLSGGSLVVADGPGPADLARAVRAGGVTWMQLVPTMLARCLADWDAPEAAEIGARLRFLRSVSADLPPARAAEAEARLGTPLIQMYGMTETAGQIASNPLPPAERRPGTVGPAAGADVILVDATGAPVAEGREGEVCVRGPAVTAGYEDAPEDQFFGGWLRTGDLGRLDDDGYLTLTGRLKDLINRGGEKISPIDVERAALSHPDVAEAVAYGLPHPSLGEQVGLTLVLRPGATAGEAALLDHLRARLAEFMRPRSLRIRPDLPRLGSGKVDRRRTAREAAQAVDSDDGARRTLDGQRATVARIWRAVLALDADPAEDDDFFEMGGDSLMAVEFLARIEAEAGRDLDANLLFEKPTFGALCTALDTAPASVAPPRDPVIDFAARTMAGWPGQIVLPGGLIRTYGPPGDEVPLFHCGQYPGQFPDLKRSLAADRTLYVLRSLHSLKTRDLAKTRRLAAHYAEEIVRIRPEGPILLQGHCEGGKVVDDIAAILAAQGREVGVVIYIDYWSDRVQRWPVLHVWSATTRYSPAVRWHRPEEALPLMAPHGAAWLRLAASHYDAMTPENVDRLAAFAAPYLAGASFPERPGRRTGPVPGPERQALYPCTIGLTAPHLVRPGAPFEAEVRLRNDSGQDWGPPEEQGFRLDTLLVLPRGKAPGPDTAIGPLRAGETRRIPLRLAAPPGRRPFALRAAMQDDGVAEFRAHGTGIRHRLILPWR